MYPISPNENLHISMKFGERYPNDAYFKKVELAGKPHLGIDISPDQGYKENTYTIIAPVKGTVIRAGFAPGYGLHVRIRSEESDKDFIHLFGHMSKLYVKEGQKVVKSTPIGVMGSSGYSTAKHLHYEVRNTEDNRINPSCYMA